MSTTDSQAEALRRNFLNGMSRAAWTVNVVTTDGPGGREGVTVSAMTSVAADDGPPTLLVCVHHESPAADAIAANGVMCVNVLRDTQAAISETFAGRIPGVDDRFAVGNWRKTPTASWQLHEALAAFDCRLLSGERVGTHHVFVAAVESATVATDGSPLVHSNRDYAQLAPLSAGSLTPESAE